MKQNLQVCIHGHFYQPPRENPWIEEIESQESARPYHDWNERIHYECYLPNAKARVLDEKGRVLDIVNNYKKISFNFGHTLMTWLQSHYPETYREVLIADEVSVKEHHGHGNAIAQVFNHMIMPLANRRDKETQVHWGLEDFRHRFKREPESIWLAETACDEETLEVLIEAGMKYVILAPSQAQSFRKFGETEWQNVSEGQIDPKRVYRYFLPRNRDKSIAIFFYDGPISKAAGFEDLLFDAKKFMRRIAEAAAPIETPQLISIATDGETFGHHKPFGDRVIAYLMNRELPKCGARAVNFGEFLEANPPEYEVQIKGGEGTSWSCMHGVKRWKEHCGCRGGGPLEWTQHWRKPLREALDWLRDETTKIFDSTGKDYFKDPWQARQNYIRIILNRNEKNIEDFFNEHSLRPLTKEEKTIGLKLLEMQRHAMLMYTSCGWFFTDISGIETVQIIQYAARVVQLARKIKPGLSVEEEFLSRLSKAKSNLPEFKDGRVIYEKLAVPQMITLDQVASFYAIHALVDENLQHQDHLTIYCYRLNILHQRKQSFGDLAIHYGRLRITSKVTLDEKDFIFIAVQMGVYDFRCSVKLFTDMGELEKLEGIFFNNLHELPLVELMRHMDRHFGEKYFSLKNLPRRERTKIISHLTREMIEKISQVQEHLYDDNRRVSEIYSSIHLPLPEAIRYAAEHTLKRRLTHAVKELAAFGFNSKKSSALQHLMEDAKIFGVQVGMGGVSTFLSQELHARTERFMKQQDPQIIIECLNIHKIAKKIKVELHLGRSQEHLFSIIKRWQAFPEKAPKLGTEEAVNMLQLLVDSHLDPEEFKNLVHRSLNPK